jgi:hypothetical protein
VVFCGLTRFWINLWAQFYRYFRFLLKGVAVTFLLTCVAMLSQGCFESNGRYAGPNPKATVDHLVDYSLVHSSIHRGVVPVFYTLKGVYGPNKLHVANAAGVSTVLELDMIVFPELEEGPFYKKSHQALEQKSVQFLRNYFGSQKKILIYTMKREIDHEMHYFVLDVKHPERDDSASDYLVTRGLVKVDHEVAKLAGYDYLIDLEKEALHQDIGVWGLTVKTK